MGLTFDTDFVNASLFTGSKTYASSWWVRDGRIIDSPFEDDNDNIAFITINGYECEFSYKMGDVLFAKRSEGIVSVPHDGDPFLYRDGRIAFFDASTIRVMPSGTILYPSGTLSTGTIGTFTGPGLTLTWTADGICTVT